jgi:type III restriction enzyme
MAKLNFEKNLPHQTFAVDSVIGVFEGLEISTVEGIEKTFANPKIENGTRYIENIKNIQRYNDIKEGNSNSNIIDIMMETGTGKTYTYTKTIFELNRNFGIFKFVVIVPTLSIKAGTVSFLKSDSVREHFKEQYNKTIKLHIVESQKGKKRKKQSIPLAILDFANSGDFDRNSIQVMIINAGMLNSDTMQKSFDKGVFDRYNIPFDAISATKPFIIIDEPHRFDKVNKTWKNIEKLNPQYILRYGATFPEKEIRVKNHLGKSEKRKIKDYNNLVYKLTAVDAFNNNLVKGVVGHITEFKEGQNAIVRFVSSDGKEASFEVIENGKKRNVKIATKESLVKAHSQMRDLTIIKLNKSTLYLSNGLELKRGDKLNPYSYNIRVQEIMIQKAIQNHFWIERELLARDIKIKPLTLFFIDNIEEYRNTNGYIKITVENLITQEIKRLLDTEKDTFYREYLENSLKNISQTHGGYFSEDRKESDEVIEKQISEILYDKEKLLSLNNPRRFIFSKWTLREGWDNPNIFGICKLRSSGSEISKLQEVGRGLRLPVNEYGNRVKDEEFFLNYFVDFTESDFVDKLVSEINLKSSSISIEKSPTKLTDEIIREITQKYNIDEEQLLKKLDEKNIIKRNNDFKEGGFEYIKTNFPLIFDGVNPNKVKKASQQNKKKVSIRVEKYRELKELWEKLNEKVILEYKFKNEREFEEIFTKFLIEQKDNFSIGGVKNKRFKLQVDNKTVSSREDISLYESEITPISTMKYSQFLKELSKTLFINIKTLHQAFINSNIDINRYLNSATVRVIKQNFNNFLMFNAIDKFTIEYKKVSNSIHPTKLTDKNGKVLKEINSSDIGTLYSKDKVADNYLFEELFFDSQLEEENIKTQIKEVVIFTKIPKNSIQIPIAGGKSYSPDFAYVLEFENGKRKLNFIVETKNIENKEFLRSEEIQKIKHAKLFFSQDIEIKFKTQFSGDKIYDLINGILEER